MKRETQIIYGVMIAALALVGIDVTGLATVTSEHYGIFSVVITTLMGLRQYSQQNETRYGQTDTTTTNSETETNTKEAANEGNQ